MIGIVLAAWMTLSSLEEGVSMLMGVSRLAGHSLGRHRGIPGAGIPLPPRSVERQPRVESSSNLPLLSAWAAGCGGRHPRRPLRMILCP